VTVPVAVIVKSLSLTGGRYAFRGIMLEIAEINSDFFPSHDFVVRKALKPMFLNSMFFLNFWEKAHNCIPLLDPG
jgi:hypothetical protein